MRFWSPLLRGAQISFVFPPLEHHQQHWTSSLVEARCNYSYPTRTMLCLQVSEAKPLCKAEIIAAGEAIIYSGGWA